MSNHPELVAAAKAIVDANVYMTIATADKDGRPWASPVYFASHDYREFYWISSTDTTHSHNLTMRPEVGIVLFDSTSEVGKGTRTALYLTATAHELAGADLERGVQIYPGGGPDRQAAWRVTVEEVSSPAEIRLYRADVTEYSMVCPRDRGQPCAPHGRVFDHRTPATL